MTYPRLRGTIEERFWPKVQKTDGCWEWTATKNNMGYGMFWAGKANRNKSLAHRISFEMANGPIAADACVLHACDNPLCVRPDHLILGSMLDNTRDMISKGRDPWTTKRERFRSRVKLSESQVRGIRARLKTGELPGSLAREHGVDSHTVRNIRDRVSWRHLADDDVSA